MWFMYLRGLSLPKEEISVARAPQMILWMYFRPIASTLYISLSVQFPELQFKREPKQTQMILWLIFFVKYSIVSESTASLSSFTFPSIPSY